VSAPYGRPLGTDGSVGGSTCGSQVLPAGPPVAERTLVLRCDIGDGTGRGAPVSSLVVVAPPTASSGRALDLGGAVLADVPLSDGVGIVPFPERAATVETLAADGTVLERTRPLTSADLGD